jgi:hypothetical protein
VQEKGEHEILSIDQRPGASERQCGTIKFTHDSLKNSRESIIGGEIEHFEDVERMLKRDIANIRELGWK